MKNLVISKNRYLVNRIQFTVTIRILSVQFTYHCIYKTKMPYHIPYVTRPPLINWINYEVFTLSLEAVVLIRDDAPHFHS